MLTLDFQVIGQQIEKIASLSKELRPKPLLFYPYLKRVLEWDMNHEPITFPYTVNIPKSNKYLIRGDFTPAYTIQLDSVPTMDDGTPIWFNETGGGMFLRFGFVNNDARQVSAIPMNQEFIHGFLGGSSGHGKSVTMNSMIGALCHEYAPWELEINLSDAKITEFKKYGMHHRIPHIKAIAATEDPDFVISVLDRCVAEMKERQKIFSAAGVSNLKEFRKKTKLAYPQVLVIMDEVESTFKLAGKQASRVASDIDDFARLGRSSGYHIFMATQNLTSDIPKSAVGQIRIRGCLGATENVSQAVLGNNGAANNFGRIGRLIVNTEVMNGGDTSLHNLTFQTPFISDDEFEGEMEFLERKGRELGYQASMSFYDEEDVKSIVEFDQVIEKSFQRMQGEQEITTQAHPIILGMPAFVTSDADELLKIWLDHKDVENILITSSSSEHVSAHLHNITKSLAANGYAIQLFTSDMEHSKWVVDPLVAAEARAADKPPLSTIGSLVRKRLFLLQLEQLANSAKFDRAAVESIFKRDKIPPEAWGNERHCRRCVAYLNLLDKDNKEWQDVRYLFPTYLEVFQEFDKYNCRVNLLTADKFTKASFIVGDLSKVIGYGRDSRSNHITALKKALQDACRVGVIYILFTRSMEGLTDLLSGLRYIIFDMPDSKEWGRTRVDEPRELKSMLALLNDNMDSDNPQKKFKRTLLHAE